MDPLREKGAEKTFNLLMKHKNLKFSWDDDEQAYVELVELSVPEEKISEVLKKEFKNNIEDIHLTQGEEFFIDTLTDEKVKKAFNTLGIKYPIPVPDEMRDYCKPIPK